MHLDENGQIMDTQHSFMQGRSCFTNLIGFLRRYIDTYKIGGAMYVVCVDFSKVFDNVPKIYANPKC